jgi:predicted membrane channel-forming protein YqfA (hemolysin III family)
MTRLLFVCLYLLMACAAFVAALVEHLRGDSKNVIPLAVLGGVALIAAIIRYARPRR